MDDAAFGLPATAADGTLPVLAAFTFARPDRCLAEDAAEAAAILAAHEIEQVALSDAKVDDILAFLAAQADREFLEGRLGVSELVTRGVPVD